MAINSGLQVPTNIIECGGNTIKKTFVAEGTVSPGDLVKYGTTTAQVKVCAAGDKNCIGVAGLNTKAQEDGNDPMTTAFTAGEECVVIMNGLVRVVADDNGFTAGNLVMVGPTDGSEVEDYTDTAAAAADTYSTTNLEAIKDELGGIIGRAMTTATSGNAGIIKLF